MLFSLSRGSRVVQNFLQGFASTDKPEFHTTSWSVFGVESSSRFFWHLVRIPRCSNLIFLSSPVPDILKELSHLKVPESKKTWQNPANSLCSNMNCEAQVSVRHLSLFYAAAHIIFTLFLISMLASTYPQRDAFVNRLHSVFFDSQPLFDAEIAQKK